MSTSEKFCLKWNDFQKNLSSSFQDIRGDFCDVTLAGEGNEKILTHKVILAASSTFFHEILRENQHPHPLLYMKGIKGVHLASVVDFMYNGEVNILQEDLNDFLSVAEELKLKGLQANEADNKSLGEAPSPCKPSIKPRNKTIPQAAKINYAQTSIDENIQEFKTKVEVDSSDVEYNTAMVTIDIPENKITTTNEELDERIRSMMTRSDGQWYCNICGKDGKTNQVIIRHIEAKHIEGVSHPCNQCGKLFRSRHGLVVHISYLHSINKT